MNHHEQQDLRRIFSQEIDLVAKLRLKGITPLSLQNQGNLQDATELSNLLGQIDINNLIPFVDQRVKELRQLAEKKRSGEASTPQEPTPPQTKQPLNNQPEVYHQGNLFDLIDTANTPQQTSKPANDWRDPERELAKLHGAFNRTNPVERNKILSPDAAHDAREFLKKVGAKTWPEKRQTLSEHYHWYVTFLQDVGLWKTIEEQGITDDIKEQLREVLNHLDSYAFDYDEIQRKTIAKFLRVIVRQ